MGFSAELFELKISVIFIFGLQKYLITENYDRICPNYQCIFGNILTECFISYLKTFPIHGKGFLIVFLLIGVFGVLYLTPFSIIEILIGLFGGGFMIVHVIKQLITGKW